MNRVMDQVPHYQQVDLGFNYRMTYLQAAQERVVAELTRMLR